MRVDLFLLFLGLSQLFLGNEALDGDEDILMEDGNQLLHALESAGRTKRQTGLTCPKLVSYDNTYPTDCADILRSCTGQSSPSGIYEIQPYGGNVIKVYCDMETDGGGWTVFQRRIDGTIEFYRPWSSYQEGFGNLNTEFWLGNDNLHYLTSQRDYELRVDLTNTLGNDYFAVYDTFRIGDDYSEYILVLGTYNSSSTAGNALSYHNENRFTTYNNDNDQYSSGNCASNEHGAWWFDSSCGYYSHLNGKYYGYSGADSVYWYYLPGDSDQIPFSEMKIRPKES